MVVTRNQHRSHERQHNLCLPDSQMAMDLHTADLQNRSRLGFNIDVLAHLGADQHPDHERQQCGNAPPRASRRR